MNLYDLSNAEIVHLLGRRFREYRIRGKLTQEEVAELAGVSIYTLRKFETGISANISLQTLLALLRSIGELQAVDDIMPNIPSDPAHLFNQQALPQRIRK